MRQFLLVFAALALLSGGAIAAQTDTTTEPYPGIRHVHRIDTDAPWDIDVVIIDTPPGMPETTYAAAMVADLLLLPCGPSPLDLFALKEALALALDARAQRRSKKPRIRFVPSRINLATNLGRGLSGRLENMGKKLLPGISQRVILAEAVDEGLTISEFAPNSPSHSEFHALAKAALKVTS